MATAFSAAKRALIHSENLENYTCKPHPRPGSATVAAIGRPLEATI
jgi:hypothetical protein